MLTVAPCANTTRRLDVSTHRTLLIDPEGEAYAHEFAQDEMGDIRCDYCRDVTRPAHLLTAEEVREASALMRQAARREERSAPTDVRYRITLIRRPSADPLADLQEALILCQAEAAAREVNARGETPAAPIHLEDSFEARDGSSRLVLSAAYLEPLQLLADDAMLRYGLELPEIEEVEELLEHGQPTRPSAH